MSTSFKTGFARALLSAVDAAGRAGMSPEEISVPLVVIALAVDPTALIVPAEEAREAVLKMRAAMIDKGIIPDPRLAAAGPDREGQA